MELSLQEKRTIVVVLPATIVVPL